MGQPANWMTLREVSEQLGVKESTLRAWRHRGYGPRSFKVGVAVMYFRIDIDRWQAGMEAHPA